MENYRDIPPNVGETTHEYCARLEAMGHEEMFIRKAVRCHLGAPIDSMAALFNSFEAARLRHITMLKHLSPNRTGYSLIKKAAKNLGISEELAALWVARFEETGELAYLGHENLKPERSE